MKELSNEELKTFIRLLDAVAILDAEGSYLYVSPGWCTYANCSYEKALKHKVWDIFPDTHAKKVYQTKEKLIAQLVSIGGRLALTSYYPLLDEQGNVEKIYLYIIIQGAENLIHFSKRIQTLTNELTYYKSELTKERGAKYSLDNIIGESAAVLQLKESIRQAAASNSTVLIEGETGTGKELIAHAIHTLSARTANHFVRVNCSAIPPELMESEFFGYKAGSFTGASKHGKIGKFEFASHGSIFLDEINLLPKAMQPKFLRVLQEREIDPIGSDKSIPVDVRVIAATNRPLEQDVQDGSFRSDLFYRLNVIRITAPALRNRISDIPLLVDHFIKRLNHDLGMAINGITPDALSMLMAYGWPGNIRELQNAIERAMNICAGQTLDICDFPGIRSRTAYRETDQPPVIVDSIKTFNLSAAKKETEKQLILRALEQVHGNKAAAAQLLGISRTMLYKKLEVYHIG